MIDRRVERTRPRRIEQPRARTARQRPATRRRLGLTINWSALDPRELILRYPIYAAAALIGVAAVVYLMQVEAGSWSKLQLQQANSDQIQLSRQRADLLKRLDGYKSVERVDRIASTQLGMVPVPFDQALWLTIHVPSWTPHTHHEPKLATGPLPWMEHAMNVVENSL